MNPHELRIQTLEALGWQRDESSGLHQICAERCEWIIGRISSLEWSAWMSTVSGMVYLHRGGEPEERDFEFDAFCKLVENGWPKVVVIPKTRGFDFGED